MQRFNFIVVMRLRILFETVLDLYELNQSFMYLRPDWYNKGLRF
jgi:hypothetical protein